MSRRSIEPVWASGNVAFRNQEINYAAAIAFLLGIIIMIVSFVVQTSTNRKERQS